VRLIGEGQKKSRDQTRARALLPSRTLGREVGPAKQCSSIYLKDRKPSETQAHRPVSRTVALLASKRYWTLLRISATEAQPGSWSLVPHRPNDGTKESV